MPMLQTTLNKEEGIMKKEYIAPTAELEVIDSRDVITTSEWNLPEVPVDGTGAASKTTKFNW